MEIKCAYTKIQDLDLLVEHPRNPNKHGEKQVKMLAKIMAHQGWRHPITVSKRSGFIVAGHGRLMAARLNGWDKAPVDEQDFSNEAEEYQHLIADNKIAELAEHDDLKMIEDIKDLELDDFELLGLSDFTIPDEPDPAKEEIEDDVPENVDTRCKPGDLWILGNHRLLCGDATNIQHVERLMDSEKADMVFTDPPYGVKYEGGHFHSGDVNIKRKREKLKSDDSQQIYSDVIPVIAQYCEGPCYTWYADSQGKALYNAIEQVGQYHAMIVWHKTNATYAAMNAQYKQRHEPCVYWKPKGKTLKWCGPTNEATVWEMKRDPKNNFHPTQKPVELAERAIANHKADKVLDLFGGSGSTLIACEKTNRNCYMMEIDPHYCDVILTRWENYTGNKAILSQDSAKSDKVD